MFAVTNEKPRVHPMIQQFKDREHAIREAIILKNHRVGPLPLLNFVREMVSTASMIVEEEDLTSAEMIARRAEVLLRHPYDSKRRFTDEDWLNMSTLPSGATPTYIDDIEAKRNELLSSALQIIARVASLQRRHSDAYRAFTEAMRITGESGITAPMLLNFLSILEHLEDQWDRWAHLSSEAVATLSDELDGLLDPQVAMTFVNGTLQQRDEYAATRKYVAKMLISAQLQLIQASTRRFVEDTAERKFYGGMLYLFHRITLALAEAQRLCIQELGSSDPLYSRVARKITEWSDWVAASSRWGSPAEELMSNDNSERWRFQINRSRQFAALQAIYMDGRHPALEFLYNRYPHNASIALLLLENDSLNSKVCREQQRRLVCSRSVNGHSTKPPSQLERLAYGKLSQHLPGRSISPLFSSRGDSPCVVEPPKPVSGVSSVSHRHIRHALTHRWVAETGPSPPLAAKDCSDTDQPLVAATSSPRLTSSSVRDRGLPYCPESLVVPEPQEPLVRHRSPNPIAVPLPPAVQFQRRSS